MKRKYIIMMCIACGGSGWVWGTLPEHQHLKNAAKGTAHVSCPKCNGSGFYKAEIVEFEEEE